ncbi:hypothetical protein OTU49_012875 [Cherax quadricarinatus]|uniref:Uncharacterized protein n=1 Tax=Cherax quadricarinatus TaxID=27406 RepID=A0AAW0VW20_CHEQU
MAVKTCCLWMLAVGIILEILGCYYQLFDPWVRDLEKERDDLRRQVDQATDACQPMFSWVSTSAVVDVWRYVHDAPVQETSMDFDHQFDPRWLPIIGRIITTYECYLEIQNLKTLLEVTSCCHEGSSTPFMMSLCVLMLITVSAIGLIAEVNLWRRRTSDTVKMAMVGKPKTRKLNRRHGKNASKKNDQDQTGSNEPEITVEPEIPVEPEVLVEPDVPVEPKVPVEPEVPVGLAVPVELTVPVEPEGPPNPPEGGNSVSPPLCAKQWYTLLTVCPKGSYHKLMENKGLFVVELLQKYHVELELNMHEDTVKITSPDHSQALQCNRAIISKLSTEKNLHKSWVGMAQDG